MTPLWRTVIGAAILGGCKGEQISGRWRGPLPLPGADSCVLNLYSDERFDLACGQLDWVGAGRYRYADDRLTLTVSVLRHGEQAAASTPSFNLRVDVHGNEIRLIDETGRSYALHRGSDR